MYDVIIIGGGPAGLAAAIYTGRAWLKTLILESAQIGGYATVTHQIDNYPGFPFGVQGAELMESFQKQAERFGAEIKMEEVINIADSSEGKKVTTADGEYTTRAVIIATGAQRRQLGVDGETEFLGRGVSYCATCDAAFFHGCPVAVVGGGESALKEALYLADIASKVYIIHRRGEFRASPHTVEKIKQNGKIELRLNRDIKKIEGEGVMQRLILRDTDSQAEELLQVEGLFVAIGLVAATNFLMGSLDTDEGYIVTDANMQTTIPGVYAAGDIRAKETRQVATAVGDGVEAAMAIANYLKE